MIFYEVFQSSAVVTGEDWELNDLIGSVSGLVLKEKKSFSVAVSDFKIIKYGFKFLKMHSFI